MALKQKGSGEPGHSRGILGNTGVKLAPEIVESLVTTMGKMRAPDQPVRPGPISSKHGIKRAFKCLFEPVIRLVRLDVTPYMKQVSTSRDGGKKKRRGRPPKPKTVPVHRGKPTTVPGVPRVGESAWKQREKFGEQSKDEDDDFLERHIAGKVSGKSSAWQVARPSGNGDASPLKISIKRRPGRPPGSLNKSKGVTKDLANAMTPTSTVTGSNLVKQGGSKETSQIPTHVEGVKKRRKKKGAGREGNAETQKFTVASAAATATVAPRVRPVQKVNPMMRETPAVLPQTAGVTHGLPGMPGVGVPGGVRRTSPASLSPNSREVEENTSHRDVITHASGAGMTSQSGTLTSGDVSVLTVGRDCIQDILSRRSATPASTIIIIKSGEEDQGATGTTLMTLGRSPSNSNLNSSSPLRHSTSATSSPSFHNTSATSSPMRLSQAPLRESPHVYTGLTADVTPTVTQSVERQGIGPSSGSMAPPPSNNTRDSAQSKSDNLHSSPSQPTDGVSSEEVPPSEAKDLGLASTVKEVNKPDTESAPDNNETVNTSGEEGDASSGHVDLEPLTFANKDSEENPLPLVETPGTDTEENPLANYIISTPSDKESSKVEVDATENQSKHVPMASTKVETPVEAVVQKTGKESKPVSVTSPTGQESKPVSLTTPTGRVASATGSVTTATGRVTSATGSLTSATGSVTSATGSVSQASNKTGTTNTNESTKSDIKKVTQPLNSVNKDSSSVVVKQESIGEGKPIRIKRPPRVYSPSLDSGSESKSKSSDKERKPKRGSASKSDTSSSSQNGGRIKSASSEEKPEGKAGVKPGISLTSRSTVESNNDPKFSKFTDMKTYSKANRPLFLTKAQEKKEPQRSRSPASRGHQAKASLPKITVSESAKVTVKDSLSAKVTGKDIQSAKVTGKDTQRSKVTGRDSPSAAKLAREVTRPLTRARNSPVPTGADVGEGKGAQGRRAVRRRRRKMGPRSVMLARYAGDLEIQKRYSKPALPVEVCPVEEHIDSKFVNELYTNPEIDEELLEKLKILFVYQHKTNGLFTYKRGRGKPPGKVVNRFFKKSFEPYILLSRLDTGLLKKTGTPLPRLMETELAEVRARRARRRSVEVKMEIKSASIFGSPAQLEDLVVTKMIRRRSSARSDSGPEDIKPKRPLFVDITTAASAAEVKDPALGLLKPKQEPDDAEYQKSLDENGKDENGEEKSAEENVDDDKEENEDKEEGQINYKEDDKGDETEDYTVEEPASGPPSPEAPSPPEEDPPSPSPPPSPIDSSQDEKEPDNSTLFSKYHELSQAQGSRAPKDSDANIFEKMQLFLSANQSKSESQASAAPAPKAVPSEKEETPGKADVSEDKSPDESLEVEDQESMEMSEVYDSIDNEYGEYEVADESPGADLPVETPPEVDSHEQEVTRVLDNMISSVEDAERIEAGDLAVSDLDDAHANLYKELTVENERSEVRPKTGEDKLVDMPIIEEKKFVPQSVEEENALDDDKQVTESVDDESTETKQDETAGQALGMDTEETMEKANESDMDMDESPCLELPCTPEDDDDAEPSIDIEISNQTTEDDDESSQPTDHIPDEQTQPKQNESEHEKPMSETIDANQGKNISTKTSEDFSLPEQEEQDASPETNRTEVEEKAVESEAAPELQEICKEFINEVIVDLCSEIVQEVVTAALLLAEEKQEMMQQPTKAIDASEVPHAVPAKPSVTESDVAANVGAVGIVKKGSVGITVVHSKKNSSGFTEVTVAEPTRLEEEVAPQRSQGEEEVSLILEQVLDSVSASQDTVSAMVGETVEAEEAEDELAAEFTIENRPSEYEITNYQTEDVPEKPEVSKGEDDQSQDQDLIPEETYVEKREAGQDNELEPEQEEDGAYVEHKEDAKSDDLDDLDRDEPEESQSLPCVSRYGRQNLRKRRHSLDSAEKVQPKSSRDACADTQEPEVGGDAEPGTRKRAASLDTEEESPAEEPDAERTTGGQPRTRRRRMNRPRWYLRRRKANRTTEQGKITEPGKGKRPKLDAPDDSPVSDQKSRSPASGSETPQEAGGLPKDASEPGTHTDTQEDGRKADIPSDSRKRTRRPTKRLIESDWNTPEDEDSPASMEGRTSWLSGTSPANSGTAEERPASTDSKVSPTAKPAEATTTGHSKSIKNLLERERRLESSASTASESDPLSRSLSSTGELTTSALSQQSLVPPITPPSEARPTDSSVPMVSNNNSTSSVVAAMTSAMTSAVTSVVTVMPAVSMTSAVTMMPGAPSGGVAVSQAPALPAIVPPQVPGVMVPLPITGLIPTQVAPGTLIGPAPAQPLHTSGVQSGVQVVVLQSPVATQPAPPPALPGQLVPIPTGVLLPPGMQPQIRPVPAQPILPNTTGPPPIMPSLPGPPIVPSAPRQPILTSTPGQTILPSTSGHVTIPAGQSPAAPNPPTPREVHAALADDQEMLREYQMYEKELTGLLKLAKQTESEKELVNRKTQESMRKMKEISDLMKRKVQELETQRRSLDGGSGGSSTETPVPRPGRTQSAALGAAPQGSSNKSLNSTNSDNGSRSSPFGTARSFAVTATGSPFVPSRPHPVDLSSPREGRGGSTSPGQVQQDPRPPPRAHTRGSTLRVIMDKPPEAHSKPVNYSMYSQLHCSIDRGLGGEGRQGVKDGRMSAPPGGSPETHLKPRRVRGSNPAAPPSSRPPPTYQQHITTQGRNNPRPQQPPTREPQPRASGSAFSIPSSRPGLPPHQPPTLPPPTQPSIGVPPKQPAPAAVSPGSKNPHDEVIKLQQNINLAYKNFQKRKQKQQKVREFCSPGTSKAPPQQAAPAIMTSPLGGGNLGNVTRVVEEAQQPSAQVPAQIACDVCGKPAMFVCSACKSVAYCSPNCQTRAWGIHSRVCR